MDPLAHPFAFLFLLFSDWINREQRDVIDYLLEENRVLRAAHGSHRIRLSDDQRRRLAVKGKALCRRRLADVAGIVTPDTILRWYRHLIAHKYDGSTSDAWAAQAPSRTSSRSSSIWRRTIRRGATHASAADCTTSATTSPATRSKPPSKNQGIEPAPERRTKTPWKTFLAAHWDALAAADFFTVEVLTWRGLVRYVVFFVMKLKTRTVKIAGITSRPHEAWMMQIARNLTDPDDGFLRDVQYLIVDRDPLDTAT